MMGDESSVLNLSWKDIGNLVGDVVYGVRSWIVFQAPFLRGCLFFPFFLLLFCFLFISFIFPLVSFRFLSPFVSFLSFLFLFFPALSLYVCSERNAPHTTQHVISSKVPHLPENQRERPWNSLPPKIKHQSIRKSMQQKFYIYLRSCRFFSLVFLSVFHKLCILRFVYHPWTSARSDKAGRRLPRTVPPGKCGCLPAGGWSLGDRFKTGSFWWFHVYIYIHIHILYIYIYM